MDTVIKIFPSENVYSSIEVHLKDNEVLNRTAIDQIVKDMKGLNYIAPKWPIGTACPVCSKGMVAYRKFQSTKPGPKQGTWYANYSCSEKSCSFVAWVKPDDNQKIPSDEPFRSAFMTANGMTAPAPATANPPVRGAALTDPLKTASQVPIVSGAEAEFLEEADSNIPF